MDLLQCSILEKKALDIDIFGHHRSQRAGCYLFFADSIATSFSVATDSIVASTFAATAATDY